MRSSVKRRLALAGGTAATLGAVTTLATGFTFGLFSASVTNTPSTFAAGSVTLATTADTFCTIGTMLPNDSSTNAPIGNNTKGSPCEFNVTYNGATPAYLAVDVSVYNPSSGTSLYSGGSSGLQLYLADTTGTNPTTYITGDTVVPGAGTQFTADTVGTSGTVTTLPLNAGPTGTPPVYVTTPDLLATPLDTPAVNGDTVHLTLNWAMPSDSNVANGGTADVVLIVHAVQATGQTLACQNIAPPVVGEQCLAGTGFSWS